MSEIENRLCGRKLVFGDAQQIKALQDIPVDREESGLKNYTVTLEYSVSFELDIKANNKDEAKELAEDGLDLNSGDAVLEKVVVLEF